jgi:GT2 family glycosyltransferase
VSGPVAGAPRAARELSVVVPTCGRPAVLRATLVALLRHRAELRDAEVVVVVDGGDEPSVSVVRELAAGAPCPLVAVTQPRSGQGIARNEGIRRAAGRVVLMLDDDIVAGPTLVAEHLRQHAGRSDLVVTGALPMPELHDEPAHYRLIRTWWDEVHRELASPAHVPTFRDFVTGNVSVPRAALLEAGLFDPMFTGYGREDYELGYRLLRAGLRFVHAPAAAGLHHYTKNVLDWLRQARPQGRADVLFARKHPELLGEVMTLSPYPLIPYLPPAVELGERLVVQLNDRGGPTWKKLAATVQAAYYWQGIRDAVQDADELERVVRALLLGRSRTGRLGFRGRLKVARVRATWRRTAWA